MPIRVGSQSLIEQGRRKYSHSFFDRQSEKSYSAATLVVPHVLRLVGVTSVVDFGCGVGTWLRAFQEHGVDDLLGFEGDWITEKRQFVSPGTIQIMDLNEPRAAPRPYALAMSLEVAEHLLPESAEPFVAALCASAPVVLFSAAIPGQGGTKHINERWQDYWAGLFAENDFEAWDIIRPLIADEKQIESFYRQNIVLYARRGSGLVRAERRIWTLNYVLPEKWEKVNSKDRRRPPQTLLQRIWRRLSSVALRTQ